MLRLENISKRFGHNVVLDRLSLEIRDGETLVIVGASGTGKSVLLKIIMTLMEPDEGKVYFNDIDVFRLSEKEKTSICGRFGMLFQDAALFDSLTVKENVGFALYEKALLKEKDIDKVVAEKLSLIGMGHVMDAMPSDLSGGMRKRVGLARAIAHEPEVILYDEPTTGLDPIMANIINRLILELKKKLGVTSVVVTHDMQSTFMIADRIAMIHEGAIKVVGTKDQIIESSDEVVQNFIKGQSPPGAGH